MKRTWVIVVVAVVLAAGDWAAEERTALDPAVYAHPPSLIIDHDLTVRERSRLELFLGIKEDAWDKGTDGVCFRVGVSQGAPRIVS